MTCHGGIVKLDDVMGANLAKAGENSLPLVS